MCGKISNYWNSAWIWIRKENWWALAISRFQPLEYKVIPGWNIEDTGNSRAHVKIAQSVKCSKAQAADYLIFLTLDLWSPDVKSTSLLPSSNFSISTSVDLRRQNMAESTLTSDLMQRLLQILTQQANRRFFFIFFCLNTIDWTEPTLQ